MPDERQRSGQICDDAHLDGVAGHGSSFVAHDLPLGERLRSGALVSGRMSAPLRAPYIGRFPAPHLGSATPRLAEFVATLALAQDNAFGQPLESQLRSCLLASWTCEAAGFEQEVRDDRLLGRPAALRRLHRPRPRGRHRVRRRDRDPRADARPRRRQPGGGHRRRRSSSRPPGARTQSATRSSGRCRRPRTSGRSTTSPRGARWPTCSSGRLEFGPGGAERAGPALRALERHGLSRPTSRARPSRSPMRVVHLSHDMEAIARLFSPERARLEAARDRRTGRTIRRSRTCSSKHGRAWFARLPRGRAVARRPGPRTRAPPDARRGGASTAALTLAADFIDMKSPYMGGHSRRCAELATGGARVLGHSEEAVADAAPGGARPRLRYDRGLELDLGQAGGAHAHGVRPGRAPHRCSPSRCSAAHRRWRR